MQKCNPSNTLSFQKLSYWASLSSILGLFLGILFFFITILMPNNFPQSTYVVNKSAILLPYFLSGEDLLAPFTPDEGNIIDGATSSIIKISSINGVPVEFTEFISDGKIRISGSTTSSFPSGKYIYVVRKASLNTWQIISREKQLSNSSTPFSITPIQPLKTGKHTIALIASDKPIHSKYIRKSQIKNRFFSNQIICISARIKISHVDGIKLRTMQNTLSTGSKCTISGSSNYLPQASTVTLYQFQHQNKKKLGTCKIIQNKWTLDVLLKPTRELKNRSQHKVIAEVQLINSAKIQSSPIYLEIESPQISLN